MFVHAEVIADAQAQIDGVGPSGGIHAKIAGQDFAALGSPDQGGEDRPWRDAAL